MSCESFICGFVDNAPVCMLYAVSAASVPLQSSTNPVVYDVGCGSVPTTTLSPTNPSGAGPASGSGGSTGAGTGTGAGSAPEGPKA